MNATSGPDYLYAWILQGTQSSEIQKDPKGTWDIPLCSKKPFSGDPTYVLLPVTPQILSSLNIINCQWQEMNSPHNITLKLCHHKALALCSSGSLTLSRTPLTERIYSYEALTSWSSIHWDWLTSGGNSFPLWWFGVIVWEKHYKMGIFGHRNLDFVT